LRGEPISVYGEGQQTRSFCYVDDLVEAILRFMNADDGFPGPLNLGNPSELTILELAQMIIRMTASRSKIVFKPLPHDDPERRRPDISQAAARLNWAPTTDLEDGIARTVQYFVRDGVGGAS
jgi:UDP-glucuronate decarboxylase